MKEGSDKVAESGAGIDEVKAQKERLEVEKLRAEIAQIRLDTGVQSRWRNHLALLLAVVTVAGAAWGLYQGADSYFRQLAREYEFKVTQEIITLSRQLASVDTVERTNAALILAAYEADAVPILVANLGATGRPGLADQLIAALSLVMQKNGVRNRPDVVLDPLRTQARIVFEEELRSSTPNSARLHAFLEAFQRLAAGTKDAKVKAFLASLGADLESARRRLDEAVYEDLAAGIALAIAAVAGPAP